MKKKKVLQNCAVTSDLKKMLQKKRENKAKKNHLTYQNTLTNIKKSNEKKLKSLHLNLYWSSLSI